MKRYRIVADFKSESLSSYDLRKKVLEIERVLSKDSLDIGVSLKKKSYLKDGILFGLFSAIWITAVSMGLNNDFLSTLVSDFLLWPFNLFSQYLTNSQFGIPLLIAGNVFYWVILGIAFGWFYETVLDLGREMKEFFGA